MRVTYRIRLIAARMFLAIAHRLTAWAERVTPGDKPERDQRQLFLSL